MDNYSNILEAALKRDAAGDNMKAIELFQTLNANYPSAVSSYNLAKAYQKSDDLDQANFFYLQAIKINPCLVEAYINLADIANTKNDFSQAKKHLISALEFNPQNIDVQNTLGQLYLTHSFLKEATSCFESCLQYCPDHLPSLFSLAKIKYDQNLLLESRDYFKTIIASKFKNADFLHTIATYCLKDNLYDIAIEIYNELITLFPNNSSYWLNLGNALHHQSMLSRAIDAYNKAIAIDNSPIAHCNLAQSILKSGDWEKGFAEYEWRRHVPEFKESFEQFSTVPCWQGQIFSKKRLLIYQEQGFGDVLQFCRFIPSAKKRGGTIDFALKEELLHLLAASELGVDNFLIPPESEINLGNYDYCVPLLSLPRVLGLTTTTKFSTSYLKPNISSLEKWQNILPNSNKPLRIGLVWAGNPNHLHGLNRTCSLSVMLPLMQLLPIADFFSLQTGSASKEAIKHEHIFPIYSYTDDLINFSETAALMSHMDIIITIDSAPAHLAGALGVPTYLLLPYCSEWRWLTNDYSTTVWYPNIKLHRQAATGDWTTPILSIVKDIQQSVSIVV